MKKIKLLLIVIALLLSAAQAGAQSSVCAEAPVAGRPCKDFSSKFIISENILGSKKIKLDSLSGSSPYLDQKVIVGGDTVSIILPDKNYGRYDRGLFNFLIIPKGQWSFGLTASYGEFNTDDIQILSILKNFDLKVKAYSLKPSISYFFRSNQSIGIKFDYTRSSVDLDNMTFDFDSDLNFSLRDISYYSQSYTASINYRNYIGLGPEKRFAIFNEVDLGSAAAHHASNGSTTTSRATPAPTSPAQASTSAPVYVYS